MTAPAKAAPRKAAKKKAAAPAAVQPEADADEDTSTASAAEATPAAPAAGGLAAFYPKGADLYRFTAKGGTVIPFPRFANLPTPNRAFFWRLYQLEPVFQGFEWMRYAGVPEEVQAVAVELPDTDYDALFDGWFEDAQLSAGESERSPEPSAATGTR